MSHANAPLSETGRLRLARCVVEDGWPLRRAAERFNVSVTTTKRWADRYTASWVRPGWRIDLAVPTTARTAPGDVRSVG